LNKTFCLLGFLYLWHCWTSCEKWKALVAMKYINPNWTIWNVFEWGWIGRWSDGRNQENPSLQTQESRVPKSDEKKVKQILELLHSQMKNQRPHNRNDLCWSFFFVWMTMQKWYLMHVKLCIICCVIPCLCFHLTKGQN
jgi:hypothetical protein